MSDVTSFKRAPNQIAPRSTCARCGWTSSVLAVLDSRGGKTFRLYKCFACAELSWSEELEPNAGTFARR